MSNDFATFQMAPVNLVVPVSLLAPVSLVAPFSLGTRVIVRAGLRFV